MATSVRATYGGDNNECLNNQKYFCGTVPTAGGASGRTDNKPGLEVGHPACAEDCAIHGQE